MITPNYRTQPKKPDAPIDDKAIDKLLSDAENLRNEVRKQSAAVDAAMTALEKQIERVKQEYAKP